MMAELDEHLSQEEVCGLVDDDFMIFIMLMTMVMIFMMFFMMLMTMIMIFMMIFMMLMTMIMIFMTFLLFYHADGQLSQEEVS